jgi:hypothetical protein|tara:strand:- start:873 stop:1100 length:228 start_codon:yes stop_codon:yes gene_type:complete
MNYHFSDDFLPEDEKQEIRDLICLPDYILLKKLQESEMKMAFQKIKPDPDIDKAYEVKRMHTILDTIVKCKTLCN